MNDNEYIHRYMPKVVCVRKSVVRYEWRTVGALMLPDEIVEPRPSGVAFMWIRATPGCPASRV